jgi:hypothetical protein
MKNQKINSMVELKQLNRRAHTTLVNLWAELSRCSTSSARRYLKEDVGFRYKLKVKLPEGNIEFKCTESGQEYVFDGKEWR